MTKRILVGLLAIAAIFGAVTVLPHTPIITNTDRGGYHFSPNLFTPPNVHAQYTQGAQWQTNDNVADLDLDAVNGCVGFLTTGAFAAGPANSGAFAGPTYTRAAANNYVYSFTTSAAASALTLDCDLGAPFTRLTVGKGVIVTGAAIQYGVQTTALNSITLPTLQSITYPAFGSTSGATLAAAGGTITTNPAVASAGLATTTSGQCYNLQVQLATPQALNVGGQRLVLETVFNQTAGTAATYQVCGVQVYYQSVVF